MLKKKSSIRIIVSGVIYHYNYDVTHVPIFYQIEKLLVDKNENVDFTHFKTVLVNFLMKIFGNIKVRFHSNSFFFIEPSAKINISYIFCLDA